MRSEVVVALRHGLWRDGQRHSQARVRCLTGTEEALLADLAFATAVAERATVLLSAAVVGLGTIGPVTADTLRDLPIGDRESLLAAIHRVTFGPRIEAVASCSTPGCGVILDLDIDTDSLRLPPPVTIPQPEYAIDVPGGDGDLHVRFRLPTGADQEHAARLAAADVRAAADCVRDRCVLEIQGPAGRPLDIASNATRIQEPLEAAIRRLDPGVETTLALSCPSCGHEVAALLDFGAYLLAELAGGETIYDQVDRIARAYHWSEADILALPFARRRRYLTLIAEGGLAA